MIQIPARAAQADIHVGRIRIYAGGGEGKEVLRMTMRDSSMLTLLKYSNVIIVQMQMKVSPFKHPTTRVSQMLMIATTWVERGLKTPNLADII